MKGNWNNLTSSACVELTCEVVFLSIVETADFADSDFKEMDAPLKGI